MPLIQVKLIEEVFTPAQKKEIITKLTDAMVSIEGEHLRPVTWVIIEEVRSGNLGIGGQAMTTEAARTRRRKNGRLNYAMTRLTCAAGPK
jgi:4-oxalocrotonate tautomerase